MDVFPFLNRKIQEEIEELTARLAELFPFLNRKIQERLAEGDGPARDPFPFLNRKIQEKLSGQSAIADIAVSIPQ